MAGACAACDHVDLHRRHRSRRTKNCGKDVAVMIRGIRFRRFKKQTFIINTRACVPGGFLVAMMLLTPFLASALSVRQYESETREQAAHSVATAIDKIVADVANVNPALSK